MAKILVNTTGSSVSLTDVGVTISASGSYTVQVADYLLFASSSNVVTKVGDGTLVVNDGSSNLSISDGMDLIKDIFPKKIGIQDGLNNNLTSQINGTQRALDIGIDVAGVQIDPRQIRALTSTDQISISGIASTFPQSIDVAKILPIGFGESVTAPSWPCKKPLGTYLVPAGKSYRLFGCMYKTVSGSNYVHIYTKTPLWNWSAGSISSPTGLTLAARSYSGAGLTVSSTYKYKIVASNIRGDTLPGTEVSVTLNSSQNAVYLSWTAVTGAADYQIFRTLAAGASNSEKFLTSTELTTHVDVSPDSALDPAITPPTSNTTSGGGSAGSYLTDYAASEVVIDTTSAISPSASPLDIVYTNIYGDRSYLTATPGSSVGSQVVLKFRGLSNPSDNKRIKSCNSSGNPWKKGRTYEAGIQSIQGVGNLPSAGAFTIYGHNHIFHMSSDQPNKWVTQYFENTFIFQGESEILFGISANTSLSSAARHDILLLGEIV